MKENIDEFRESKGFLKSLENDLNLLEEDPLFDKEMSQEEFNKFMGMGKIDNNKIKRCYVFNDDIIHELNLCTTKSNLDGFFNKYNFVFSNHDSIKTLVMMQCMSVINNSFDIENKDDYEDLVKIFLEGSWRKL